MTRKMEERTGETKKKVKRTKNQTCTNSEWTKRARMEQTTFVKLKNFCEMSFCVYEPD